MSRAMARRLHRLERQPRQGLANERDNFAALNDMIPDGEGKWRMPTQEEWLEEVRLYYEKQAAEKAQ
jgi:hypothetical protein